MSEGVIGANTSGRSLEYRADIDGLRAIAVMLVLVFHFDLLVKGKAGFIGVDIFYVISGFLITGIVKKQLDAESFSLKRFYVNRIRRLAPALFVTLTLVTIAGALWLFPADFLELSRQVLYSQIYLANFYFWKNINYFGLQADSVFLLHTWSLAVEEQFYLIYPVLLVFVHRFLRKYFWHVLLVSGFLSFWLNVHFVVDKPGATFYLLPTRAWELLIGAYIHLLFEKGRPSRMASEILGISGVMLIGVAVIVFEDGIRFPGFFALLPTLGAAFVLLSGVYSGTAVSRILSARPLVYVGKISYSLYLVHWPINVFAKMVLLDAYTIQWRFFMFLASIAAAILIFHSIEDPIRQRRIFGSDKWFFVGYGAGIVLTIAVFLWIRHEQGIPARFPAKVMELAQYVNDKSPPLSECEFSGKRPLSKSDFCQIGVPSGQPEWLIYGDSHAWAGYEVFDKWLKARGQSGLFMFRNSCPPITGIHVFMDGGKCFSFNQAIAGFLASTGTVKNVLLVSTWRQAFESRITTDPDLKLTQGDSIKVFGEKFDITVRHQFDAGLNVYVWEPVPGARHNVPSALARGELSGKAADLKVGYEEYRRTFSFFFDAINRNRPYIKMTFSPSRLLCDNNDCEATINGKPAYFDNAHISRSPSDAWVRMMHETELASK